MSTASRMPRLSPSPAHSALRAPPPSAFPSPSPARSAGGGSGWGVTVAVLGAALLLAFPASAFAFPAIDFTAGFNSETIPDRSFDFVSATDQLNQFAFSAALQPAGRLPLWIELGYQYGNNGASLHQAGTADLDVHDILLSLIFRHRVLQYFTWLARVGGTLSISHLTIEDSQGAADAAQWRVVPGAEGTLGLEVPFYVQDATGIPDPDESVWRRVGVGMRVEAGYAWQPQLAFNSLSRSSSGSIPSQSLAIGGIGLEGVIIRASLFVRY